MCSKSIRINLLHINWIPLIFRSYGSDTALSDFIHLLIHQYSTNFFIYQNSRKFPTKCISISSITSVNKNTQKRGEYLKSSLSMTPFNKSIIFVVYLTTAHVCLTMQHFFSPLFHFPSTALITFSLDLDAHSSLTSLFIFSVTQKSDETIRNACLNIKERQ